MIVLLILLILILACLILGFIAVSDNEGGILIILIGFILLIIPIVSIYNHTSDLASLRQGQLLVDVRQEAINEIDKQLQNIKISQTALMNGDSPVSSLVTTKAKFVEELAEEKIKIAKAKISIEKRSLGLMYGIVKIFGKE